ncbi:MAG TPA: glycoside hydrolase family 127 protein [Balneolaceae bacterium]|nr:glycoside hydrolase family 127 protein [Balneolaceae bacterium]
MKTLSIYKKEYFQNLINGALLYLLSIGMMVACNPANNQQSKKSSGYPITPVSFTKVKVNDNFWSQRIKTNRDVTIPFGLDKIKKEGRIRNFDRAAGKLGGKYEGQMPFDDTDVYKIIEGASYSLQTHYDKQLDEYLDQIISEIAAAQKKDGYLTTWKEIDSTTTPANWVDPGPRWHDLQSSHELYNAGHMYEAAYAHYRATGKKNFLNVALKNADLVIKTFGPDKLRTPPGHEIIEKGLVKLYRATGDKKYLDQAKFFLDQRGDSLHHKLYGAYNQDQKPVTQQDEAVGHAVRAGYLYSGMADIAALMNDDQYLKAVDRIWDNVVGKKIYITGGIGARHEGESFGDNYELPNLTAYNETCAAIANVYWNHRMFLLHGDAKYMDVLERTMYNAVISGVSLKGDTFFYPNPLESNGKYKFNQGALTRKPWFAASCCPTNAMRFLSSVPKYMYAYKGNTLYTNLFIASDANIQLGDGSKINLSQETNYPWNGNIKIKVDPEKSTDFAMKIRIPGWARNEPMPSDLYSYIENKPVEYDLKVNGKPVQSDIQKGYVTIDRQWKKGDVIELNLPMPVRKIQANPKVAADEGRVALERGPIVYCAEFVDNKADVLKIQVPDDAQFTYEFKSDLLGGVMVLHSNIFDGDGQPTRLTAIPYAVWSNRGVGKMEVWMHNHNM